MGYTFIDLFAGIGGLRLALESTGARCVYSNEWNKFSRKTYEANFHEIPDDDITKVDASDIPSHDILVGGFPCQPFSIAGVSSKRSLGRATGFADETQGTLFFDVCRIIAAKRPKAFFLENVKNLKSHDGGRTFEVIRDCIEELDYELYEQVLDASQFVPQHRERIVLIGFDRRRYDGVRFDFSDMREPDRLPRLSDILEDEVPEKYTLSDRMWEWMHEHAARHKALGHGFGFGLADPDGVSRTLSARYYKDGSEILIPQDGRNPRRLTPRECARLQGFPDSFVIPVSDTQAYKQFGNSVAVPLMSEVARLLTNELNRLDRASE